MAKRLPDSTVSLDDPPQKVPNLAESSEKTAPPPAIPNQWVIAMLVTKAPDAWDHHAGETSSNEDDEEGEEEDDDDDEDPSEAEALAALDKATDDPKATYQPSPPSSPRRDTGALVTTAAAKESSSDENDEEGDEEDAEEEEEEESGSSSSSASSSPSYDEDEPVEGSQERVLALQYMTIDLDSSPKAAQIHAALNAARAEEQTRGGCATKTWLATLAVLQDQPVPEDLRGLLPESLRPEGGWTSKDCPVVKIRALLPGDSDHEDTKKPYSCFHAYFPDDLEM